MAVRGGCLIAYGQTGAGKTFTMQGPDDHTVDAEDADAAVDAATAAAAALGDGSAAAAAAAAALSVPEDMKGLSPRVLVGRCRLPVSKPVLKAPPGFSA
jgi:hypothetical protein